MGDIKVTPANVLVFYVNIDGIAPDDVPLYVDGMKKTFDINWEGTEFIFLPVRGQSTRIEVMHLQPPHEKC